MAKIKKVEVEVRPALLEKLTAAYLSGYAPSRTSVAHDCSVSKMTSGKVAHALIDSGFMVERRFSMDGERTCAHLFCRDSLCVLVIDISTRFLKMNIINALGECKHGYEYELDSSIPHVDNMEIFLSRGAAEMRRSGRPFCSVSVILPEVNDRSRGIFSKEYVFDTVQMIIGRRPISCFTPSSAICEALKFKVHGSSVMQKGISYIFIGEYISAFHIYPNGSVAVCAPHNILTDSDKKALLNSKMASKTDAERIFLRIADFMTSAFASPVIILESDIFTPDSSTLSYLTRHFALTDRNAPTLLFKNAFYPLVTLGAVRSTLFAVIKKYITSSI